ncbi:NAD(P)H-dependent oxidoreductase [Roseomonas sp. E05]|uniref:NADPH-dependent FMN reductase n=1 Tax=Roseomonas sp. E05 TaxID=3046310 RepID=UPI0024B8CF45|nr:NAD(P)H-dependent oxidoreductase [Roseomonas sp. E05]MDJ0390230.1 NAD(P)H-dependent oxidoreductase [Roseomonas sp. E05]
MSVSTTRPVRLLGLPGSLRQNSYSLAILRGLQAGLGAEAVLEIRDLQLPLYNQDEDGPNGPEAVHAFRRAIAEADGLVIATPEYNHGAPGVLKNALDWASRPYGQSVLTGKPVLIISSSPAFTGGVRAQAQLNETLLSVQALLVPGPQVVIGNVAAKVQDGRLVDEASLEFALAALRGLAALCRSASRLEAPAAVGS